MDWYCDYSDWNHFILAGLYRKWRDFPEEHRFHGGSNYRNDTGGIISSDDHCPGTWNHASGKAACTAP